MDCKLITLAVFFISHSSLQSFVVSQQINFLQPYFAAWNGSYYIFMYTSGGSVTWGLAVDTCRADGGVLPVITVAERDALFEDFYHGSSETNDDGFVWLGADCSNETCTEDGDVLDEALWDLDYPTPNATDDRALIWTKERLVKSWLRGPCNSHNTSRFSKWEGYPGSLSPPKRFNIIMVGLGLAPQR